MTIEIDGLHTVAEGFAFTECPRWHDGRLYFSDMYGCAVYRMSEEGAVEEVVREPARPGGLGFLADGSLLVAAMDAGRIMRLALDGAYTLHCDLSAIAPGGINDMVVSRAGRCYVAHFSHTMPPPSRPLLFVDAEARPREMDDPLKVANGMILTADGARIIVAESAGGRLSVLDLDGEGRPSNRRTFADLPPGHYADGICGDAAGGAWVTCCRGPGVVRVEEGGAVTHRIAIGGDRYAYACALGGAEGRTLFVCTAGPYRPDSMAEERTSRIEAVRVPHAGQGIP